MQIYAEVHIKMCDDVAKAQAIWKKVEEGPLAKIKEELKRQEDVKFTATLNGNTVSVKVLNKIRNGERIQLPEELQSGLRDVD
jgi:hypothetical protein